MPAQVAIPLRFNTADPEALKKDLERLAQALDLYTRGAADVFAPRLSAILQLNPPQLSLGMIARVNLIDGDVLNMQLPPPDQKNFGKKCAVLRETITGSVRIRAPNSTVAGVSDYQMANDIHFVEFLLDDGDWYPTRPGAGIAL